MPDLFCGIQVLNPLPALPQPVGVGEETRTSSTYHFAGRSRPDGCHCIFQYTLAGWGQFIDGAGTHRLPAGTAFLCESDDPATAYGYAAGNREPWHFVYIGFVGEAAQAMVRGIVNRFGGVHSLPPVHPAIVQLRGFLGQARSSCTLTAADAARLVFDLLAALVAAKEAVLEQRPDHVLVRRAREFMDHFRDNNLNVSDVARGLQVSREHLTRVFTQQTGCSPYQYMLRQKLLLACRLLLGSNLSVKEVARASGCESAAHFVRLFRRGLGLTPGAFRRRGTMPLMTGKGV